jgi:hypothetical protein
MKIYYAEITDFAGKAVMNLEYTASAKHSAKLAEIFIKNCPPAQGFNIKLAFIDAKHVVSMMNNYRG